MEGNEAETYFVEWSAPDEKQTVCVCCGATSVVMWGYVYQGGDAYGVYYAAFSTEHEPAVLLSWGGWGEGSDPRDRAFVALALGVADGRLKTEVAARSELPGFGAAWADVEGTLGVELAREDALRRREEWFAAYAAVLQQDPRVGAGIRGELPQAT